MIRIMDEIDSNHNVLISINYFFIRDNEDQNTNTKKKTIHQSIDACDQRNKQQQAIDTEISIIYLFSYASFFIYLLDPTIFASRG
jgi:hypothetical protein